MVSRPSVTTQQDVIEQELIQLLSNQKPKRSFWSRLTADRWLLATFFCACIASVAALWDFFTHYEILLTGDTYAHMLIARRLFDSLTPGIAQLGGIWLPLPHILMLPFIWNDYLWHTGLAGSFAAMPCYVISAVYIFLSARRLTHDSRASFIGTLAFIVNPNILYLQTTPLSEPVLVAMLTMASYYFLAWAQENELKYLIYAGGTTALATLARYDAWFLFLAQLVAIVIIGRLRRYNRNRIEGNLITFGILGGLGIVLWVLWGIVIFKDPLYFQHSAFSSQAQQESLIKLHLLFTYHNLWQSIRTYSVDAALNLGPAIFVLGTIGLVVFLWQRRITPETLAALLFLAPFVFYVVSLYTGQAALFVPGASPDHAPSFSLTFYNTRYGIEVLAPAALFIAILASRHVIDTIIDLPRISSGVNKALIRSRAIYHGWVRSQAAQQIKARTPKIRMWLYRLWVRVNAMYRGVIEGHIVSHTVRQLPTAPEDPHATSIKRTRRLLQAILILLILGQSAATGYLGIISLQDGQYGLDCAPLHPIVVYLAQHYAGGRLLADTFTSGTNALGLEVGVDFKDVIYEGSASLWTQALNNPAGNVEWIVANPLDRNDLITRHIHLDSPAFQAQFTQVVEEQHGLSLYHRNGGPRLPTRAVPPGLLTEHRLCGATAPEKTHSFFS